MTTRVLHVHTSPLGETSVSRTIGAALREHLPHQAQVRDRDLVSNPLPHWTPEWAGAEQAQALIEELLATNLLILEVPMYNFGIPSSLKAWFDTVTVAGRTFHYTETGPVGHLPHLDVVILSSRGGRYDTGHPADFQEAYVRHMLEFLGVSPHRIVVIRAEALALGEAERSQSLAQAMDSFRSEAITGMLNPPRLAESST